MENAKKTSQEFISKESEQEVAETEQTRTSSVEFDAVHPRFRDPPKPEVVEEWQRENDYYCTQCKLFFAPDIEGLDAHFKRQIIKHTPLGECFYCNGPVYAYMFNRQQQLYHNCDTKENKQSETTP